jgi:hypothetical protein
MGKIFAAVALIVIFAASASAQQPPGQVSPYREQQRAGARGLSPQEIDDLEAGRGLGLARAAELNGYPGPRHVLDAARDRQMSLTPEQREGVQRVFDAMARDAQRIGARVIAEEQALEAAFRGGTIGEAELNERVSRLALMQGELRQVHLRAHLATRALMTDVQVARYNELRGYDAAAPATGHQHRH